MADAPVLAGADPASASAAAGSDPTSAAAVTVVDFPRALPASPALLLAEELRADDAGVLWQARTWMDPDDGSTWTSLEELGLASQLQTEQLLVVNTHLWRIRSWRSPDFESAWDETEDLGITAATGSPQ
jgi:hypothetical protein